MATFRQAVAADPQDAGAYRGLASVVVAEHHVPPRQHDGRRLPRSPHKPNTLRLAAAAAGDGRRLSRRARQGHRAGARSASRRTRTTPTRTISSARPSACAPPTPPRSRAACAARFARRARPTTKHENGPRPRSRSARTPASSSAPIATSSRRWRCRCAWSPTWRDSAAARKRGMQLIEEAAALSTATTRPTPGSRCSCIYNREKRYDDALKQLATLRERVSAQPPGLARNRIDAAARRARRRGRTLPHRRAVALRRRPRGRECSAKTRCGDTNAARRGGARTHGGRRGRSAAGHPSSKAASGSTAQPFRARQAGAEGGQQGRRQITEFEPRLRLRRGQRPDSRQRKPAPVEVRLQAGHAADADADRREPEPATHRLDRQDHERTRRKRGFPF